MTIESKDEHVVHRIHMARTGSASTDLHAALTRSRRRMVIAQVCDRFCTGGLVAIIVMLSATVVGAVLGLDPHAHWLGVAVLVVALAPMLGAIPRLTDAAITLDRLNQTDELISTAWLIRDRSDPWSAQLIGMAEGASRSMIAPRVTGRHGWRPLGAITLALVASTLAGSLIQDRATTDRSGDIAAATNRAQPSSRSALPLIPRLASGDPQTQFPERSALLPDPRTGAGQSRNSDGDDSRGAGRATASAQNGNEPRAISATPVDTRTGHLPGTGDGTTASHASGSGAHGTVASEPAASLAPWLTPTWPAAQTAVDQALRAGEYPDTYRPLIRAYFSR